MVQFVHLPSTVLAAATREATAALPLYTRLERALIAARLRSGLDSGNVSQRQLGAALQSGQDAGVARLGARLARTVARSLAGLQLPATLPSPIDPYFADASRRNAMRQWLRAFIRHNVLTATEVHDAVAEGDVALAQLLDLACERFSADMLRRVAEGVGMPELADDPLKWTVQPACVMRLSSDVEGDVVMYPNEDVGFSVTLVDRIPATALLIEVCDALNAVSFELLDVQWPRDVLDGRNYFSDSVIDSIRGYTSELVETDGVVTYTDDFLVHVNNEFGLDPQNTPEDAELISRLLRFDREYPDVPRDQRGDPVERLTSLHRRADGAATGSVLPALCRWVNLACPYEVKGKVSTSSLDEEGGTYLTHVVVADLTGFEPRFVNDMADANMSCASEGAVALTADDPFDALTLAVYEVCRISVLDRLLCRLGTAR